MLDSVRSQYKTTKHYERTQHLVHLKEDGSAKGGFLSEAAAEKLAQQARTGGFNIAKDNLCEGCFEFKSVNGACGCLGD